MNYHKLPYELRLLILKKLSTLNLFNLLRAQEASGQVDTVQAEESKGSLKNFYTMVRFELFDRRGEEACRYQNLFLKAWLKQWSILKKLSFIQNDEDKKAWLVKLTGAMEDTAASIEHKLRCSLLINKLYPNINDNAYKIVENLDLYSLDRYSEDISFAPIWIAFFDELDAENKRDFEDGFFRVARIRVGNEYGLSLVKRRECHKILSALGSAFSKWKIDIEIVRHIASGSFSPWSVDCGYLEAFASACDQDSTEANRILYWLMIFYKKHNAGHVGKTLSKLALCWPNKREMILDFYFQDVRFSVDFFKSLVQLLPFATLEQKSRVFYLLIENIGNQHEIMSFLAWKYLAKFAPAFDTMQKGIIYDLIIRGTMNESARVRIEVYGVLGLLARVCTQQRRAEILKLLLNFENITNDTYKLGTIRIAAIKSIAHYGDICSQGDADKLLNLLVNYFMNTHDSSERIYLLRALEKIVPRCSKNELMPHIGFFIECFDTVRNSDSRLNLCAILSASIFACSHDRINQIYLILAKEYCSLNDDAYHGVVPTQTIFTMLLNLAPYLNDSQLSELKKYPWGSKGRSLISNYLLETLQHVKKLNENKTIRYGRLFFKNTQDNVKDNIEEIKPSKTFQYQLYNGVIEASNDFNSELMISKSKIPQQPNATTDGWIIELPAGDTRLDFVWAKVLKAIQEDKLHHAKVSGIDETGKFKTQTIIVYTTNYADYNSVFDTYTFLIKDLRIPDEYIVGYKRDIETQPASSDEKYWIDLKEPKNSVVFHEENYSRLPLEGKRIIFHRMSQLRRKSNSANITAFELFKHELQNTFTRSWNPFKRSEMLNLMRNGTIKTIEDVAKTINSPSNQSHFSRSREILRSLGN